MLSAVIVAKNEEEKIGKLLESLSFCDEVIVIDNDSTDKTSEVAKRHGATVVTNTDTDFSVLRNDGLKRAKGEWVLYVDADEVVGKKLREEITSVLAENKADYGAYYIKRRDVWQGRELQYGEVHDAAHTGLIRLVKKGAGKWEGAVHERFVSVKPVGTLANHLMHYPHPTVAEFLSSVNIYSTLRAKELYGRGVGSSVFSVVLYPTAKFIYTYLLKMGFRDGMEGLIYCIMMTFHSFLVRSKLYLLYQEKPKVQKK